MHEFTLYIVCISKRSILFPGNSLTPECARCDAPSDVDLANKALESFNEHHLRDHDK